MAGLKGLLNQAQFPFIHKSSFSVIPKGSLGKWRLIVDMFALEGASINDGINESVCLLAYPSIEHTMHNITCRGQEVLLAKVDIKSAYWIVLIHPKKDG